MSVFAGEADTPSTVGKRAGDTITDVYCPHCPYFIFALSQFTVAATVWSSIPEKP